ncbi:MAG: bile acid:sodium symporter family protein [Candidatus Caldatribacteriaceae bacterium]
MKDFWQRGNIWMSKRMFLVVLLPVLTGFILQKYFPSGLLGNGVVVVLFAYMTFVTSLEITWQRFLGALSSFGTIVWMLFLIHGVMPLIAFLLARAFFINSFPTQLGFLVGTMVPVGVTSIIWTSVTGGDSALALAVVTVDTILVPLWFPFFLGGVASQYIPVSYGRLFYNLIWMVTVPSVAGMSLATIIPHFGQGFARSVGGFTAKVGLALVVFVNALRVAPEIRLGVGLGKMFVALFLLVISGYLLGYGGSLIFPGRRFEGTVAMVYNVGMRNLSFALVLAISYLPSLAAVPLTMLMLYQQPLAGLTHFLLNRYKQEDLIG